MQIDGDVDIQNTGSSADCRTIFGDAGDVTVNGDVIVNNSGTSTTSNVQIANNANSTVTLGGVLNTTNAGSGTTSNIYIGNAGDISVADSLYVLNSSAATNSLVYCNFQATSSATYNGDIVIENSNAASDGVYFGQNNGTATLAAGQSFEINNNGFQAGTFYLRNFTHAGAVNNDWTLTNNASAIIYDCDFGGDITIDVPNFNSRGTAYGGDLTLRKTGATNDNQLGGNTIQGVTTITNTGTGYTLWGNGTPDSFLTGLTIFDSSSFNLYIGYNSAGNYVDGNLTYNKATTGVSTYAYFCDLDNSELTVTGDFIVTNNSTASNPRNYLGDNGSLTVQGAFSLTDNNNSATSYNYLGTNQLSSVDISGDLDVVHGNSGTGKYTYVANSGDLTIGGDLTIDNNNSINDSRVWVSNTFYASVDITGVVSVDNDGSGTIRQVYIGNQGDVTLADTLTILNNSDAASSQIYLNHDDSSTVSYNGPIVLESTDIACDGVLFGNSLGNGTLAAGQTISFTANGFDALNLYFRNFTQVGPTAQTLNTGGSCYIFNYQSRWGGDVDFSGERIYLFDNVFEGDAIIEKDGATNDASAGSNVFQGNTTLNCSGSGYFLMGNGNPDSFLLDLSINNTGTNNMYIAYNGDTNYVGGDLISLHNTTGGNTYTYISSIAGTHIQIDGDVTLTNTSSSTGSWVYFANSGTADVDGSITTINNGSGNSSYMYLCNAFTSSIDAGGVIDITNNGTAAVTRTYLCNWGDLIANDSVLIQNTSSSTSSEVYCNLEDSSVAQYLGPIVLESTTATTDGVTFGQNGGSASLADGQTITIGAGGFVAGPLYFYRFNQIGSTSQTLNATGTAYMYQFESDWDGNVDFSAPRLRTDFTRYDGTAILEKTGTTDDASVGGNYFADTTTLNNSGTRYFMMGNGNPDTFNLDLNMNFTGSYGMYLAQNSVGNYVNGDLTINITSSGASSTFIASNAVGASLTIEGDVTINNNSTANSAILYFPNDGDMDINGDFTIDHISAATNNQVVVADAVQSLLNVQGVSHFSSSGPGSTTLFYVGLRGDINFSDSVYLLNNNSGTTNEFRIAYEDSSTVTFLGDIVVESANASCDGLTFGQAGGNSSLADGQRIIVGPNGHSSGALYFYRFNQIGNTAQSLTCAGTSYIYNFESDWDADLTLIAPRNRTDYSDFDSDLIFTKTGAIDETSSGGNRVGGNATLSCEGSGYLYWGNVQADSVIGNLTLTNTGTRGIIYALNNAGNYVGGNIVGTNTGSGSSTWIYLSNGTSATLRVDGDVELGGVATSTNNNLRVGQNGDVDIGGELTLRNEATSTNSYTYVAQNANSTVDIAGVATLTNTSAGTTHRCYFGENGDVSFGDSVYAINSSPATNSDMYFNQNANSVNTYAGDIVLEASNASSDGIRFGNSNGSATLAAGQTVSLTANGFIAGLLYFRNFTQVGATAQSLTLTGTATMNNLSSDWGGDVDFAAPRFYTSFTRYRGTADFEKTGANSDASAGANRIDGDATLTNSGSGYFLMGNGNPDSLMANATFINSGTHYMYFAHNAADNYIGGDLDITQSTTGTNTYFYMSTGTISTIQIDGDVDINNNSTASNPRIYFGENGDITIGGRMDVTNTANGTNSYVYLANGTNSTVDIGGVSRFEHYPTGANTHNLYLASNGDITFGDSLYILSNSPATNNLVYANNGANSSNTYNGPILLECYNAVSDGIYFGSGNGLGTLTAGNTISIGPNGFSSGQLYFRNFDQQGATAQSISLTGASTIFNIYDSEWDGDLDFDAPRVFTRGTVYNGDLDYEKTGGSNDQSVGGNTFNGDLTVRNSGTGYFMLPNNVADDYNGDVTYVKTSTGLIYPAYNVNSSYAGDINLDANTQIHFSAAGNGRVTFDSTQAQSINDLGTSPTPLFRNITMNKLGDSVTLNMPIEIQTNVTFTDGIMSTDSINIITFRDNSTATTASDDSFVDGFVEKIGNEAFDFPVGDSLYRPISISAPTSGSASFRATYLYENASPTYAFGLVDAPIDHVSSREYWLLDRLVTTNNVTVTLSWDVNSGGVTNLAELLVARWDGDSWTSHGNGGTTGNTTTGTIVSSGAVTSFSPFTLASSTANNPLPVELLSFRANPKGDDVLVNWVTAAEINNDYFSIERSADGTTFEELAQIAGAGNSRDRIEYNWLDESPFTGKSYYRLKQTDFDGVFNYSEIEAVEFESPSHVSIFESNHSIIISVDNDFSEQTEISVRDVTGKLVLNESWEKPSGGGHYRIDQSKIGAAGIYLISIEGNLTKHTERLFIR